MPKYRLLRDSFIGGRIMLEGETVEFSGNAGPNLEALDADAKKRQAAYTDALKATDPNRMSAADPGFPLKMARAISGEQVPTPAPAAAVETPPQA